MNMNPNQPQKNLIHSTLAAILVVTSLGMVGCDKNQPSKQAEKQIDQAADNAKANIDQAKDVAEQRLDNAKEASKATLDNTEKNIDSIQDSAQQNLEQAKDNAKENLEAAKDVVSDKAAVATEQVDDAVVTLKVKAAIENEPTLKATRLDVNTVNGVVKVSGSVNSEVSRAKVIEVAKSQSNVKSVEDYLVVDPNITGK